MIKSIAQIWKQRFCNHVWIKDKVEPNGTTAVYDDLLQKWVVWEHCPKCHKENIRESQTFLGESPLE